MWFWLQWKSENQAARPVKTRPWVQIFSDTPHLSETSWTDVFGSQPDCNLNFFSKQRKLMESRSLLPVIRSISGISFPQRGDCSNETQTADLEKWTKIALSKWKDLHWLGSFWFTLPKNAGKLKTETINYTIQDLVPEDQQVPSRQDKMYRQDD